ncbi:MAG: F0F1 ATP synthase subunit A [Limisphaerales bacterium]
MKRLSVIVLVCAFFAAIYAANAQPSTATGASHSAAQSVSTAATTHSGAAPAEQEEELPPAAPPPLFYIGASPDKNVPSIFGSWWPQALRLPVTNSVICSWIVAAVILLMVRATTPRHIKEIPAGMQNLLEAVVEGWEGFMADVLDRRVTRWVFPFATTFLIFIVMCNYVDLIPGVGSIGYGTPVQGSALPFNVRGIHPPLFRPPTTDANLTVAMTAVFLIMSLYWAIRYNGVWGFAKHIFGVKMKVNAVVLPIISLLFLFIGAMEVVSILFGRPVALAMRLYGNIFAGETMLDMGAHMPTFWGAQGVSLIIYFYETFICAVQGFVFGLLVVAFVGTMCVNEEKHGH